MTQSLNFAENVHDCSSECRETLYVGMAQVKSHVIRLRNASKLSEKALLNTPATLSDSSLVINMPSRTYLQFSA